MIAAQWPIDDLSAMLLMTTFQRTIAASPEVGVAAALSRAAHQVAHMTGERLVETGHSLATELRNVGSTVVEAAVVASGCLIRTLEVLGDFASVKVAEEIVAAAGAGDATDPLQTLSALWPQRARAQSVFPFEHPRHWGAFIVVGRASGESVRSS